MTECEDGKKAREEERKKREKCDDASKNKGTKRSGSGDRYSSEAKQGQGQGRVKEAVVLSVLSREGSGTRIKKRKKETKKKGDNPLSHIKDFLIASKQPWRT